MDEYQVFSNIETRSSYSPKFDTPELPTFLFNKIISTVTIWMVKNNVISLTILILDTLF